jgi:hypothetical protein
MENVGTMVCEGFDDELRVALSHTRMWRNKFMKEEIEGSGISDWDDWDEYSMIPEIVMYLSGDTAVRKKEVKDLCIAKLKPSGEGIVVDEVDDDMSDAEESSDEDKGIRKHGAESLARYNAKYESTVTAPNPTIEAMEDTTAMKTIDSAVPIFTPSQTQVHALSAQMMNMPHTPVSIGATDSEQHLESDMADMTAAFGQVGNQASASASMTAEELDRAVQGYDAAEALIERRETEEANAQRRVQGTTSMTKTRAQSKPPKSSKTAKSASKNGSKN